MNHQKAIPHAGRPRGDAWRALQAEGIEWEAQVILGTEERPLSARLIITEQRLAFARGGEVVLDIERRWLKRPPFLNGNGAINLRIETPAGHRDRIQFIARDGRQVAKDMVTLLTHGRAALPDAPLEPAFTGIPERRSSRPVREPNQTSDPAVETPVVHTLALDHKYTADVIDATTLQVLDTTDFPPLTEAASPSTHIGSVTGGGRTSGEPITISTLANQSHRAGVWSLNPIPYLTPKSDKLNKVGWAFRLSGLVALIALAAAFGSNRLPNAPGFSSQNPSINAPTNQTSTSVSLAQNIPTATPALPIFNGVDDTTRTAAETAISLGVGGETIVASTATATTAPPTDTATPTATNTPPLPTATATLEVIIRGSDIATETATIEPTATATEVATKTELPTETQMATEPATSEPTVAATDVPVDATATEPVVDDPSSTTTVAPVATATETVPATSEPTGTEAPTVETIATVAPTETAVATETATPKATATPGFPAQERTIGENVEPDQVFATGAFRYTIEFAQRGAEITTLELPAAESGEWVVVVLHAENWSDEPATLNMADFQLLVSGDFGWQFVGMDARSSDIGRFLGFDPILAPSELSSIKDGEGIRLALVFQIPISTTGMELVDDTSGLNLGESLALGGDVTALGSAPAVPELVPAVVTSVIDGRTIVVEADGYSATIQYLGINVPTGDECFASDATLTNSNIVLGATVYLEREFRNRVSSDGDALARDVWIDNQQGGLVLVAAWMASEGAAVAAPGNQDTRFAGWIQAAAGSAEANGYGFWATCGAAPVDGTASEVVTEAAQASLPIDPLLDFDT